MKLCPIAIVAGCAACPIVRLCPLKGVVGDWKPVAAPPVEAPRVPKARPKPKAAAAASKKPRPAPRQDARSGRRP